MRISREGHVPHSSHVALALSLAGLDLVLGSAAQVKGYPPFDIVQLSEDDYRIQLAVAGFKATEISITQERERLTVQSDGAAPTAGQATVLSQGIARRPFRRDFHLAEHVKVGDVSLVDGILTINLRRDVPEADKPRRIPISG